MKNDNQPNEKSIDRTVDVTKYIFHAPNPYQLLFIILIIGILLGFALTFDLNNPAANFESDKLTSSILGYGIIAIALPAIISALISRHLAESLGGRFYYRRSVLLAVIAILVFSLVMIICKILTIFIRLELTIILIFCYSAIFVIRHSVLVGTSNHNHLNSLPASLNHSILGFAMVIILPAIAPQITAITLLSPEYTITMNELLYMTGFCVIFIITTILWTTIISLPLKKNYNVNGPELAALALGQFTKQNKQDIEGLEKFFESFGKPIDTSIGAVCLKPKNAKDKKHKYKAILLVPGIHPGPFGYVGGSNLPIKLARELRQFSNNVMVFHGASTHDYNPVKSAELTKIVHELKKLILTKKPSYSSNSSKLIRLRSSVGSIQICAQVLGNGVLIVYTSSPESTDDLDYGIGEKAVLAARQRLKLADNALFIDSHNCLEKGLGSVAIGSKKSDEILRLVAKSITSLNDGPNGIASSSAPPKLKAGFASNNSFSIKDGIGPQGIQVLAIETLNRAQGGTTSTPNGSRQKAAYILIDGNNILPNLREQILENIRDLVDEAEVFTSDNHVVNITMGGYNPVGLKGSPKKVIAIIQELVVKALQDLEVVEVSVNSGKIKNLKVFGHGNTVRLSKTINRTLSIMSKSVVACNLLAIIGCITLYLLI